MYPLADAALLGLASGPACLASCGPVLVPSLAARGSGFGGTALVLGTFLSGRLVGYLAFSVTLDQINAALAATSDDYVVFQQGDYSIGYSESGCSAGSCAATTVIRPLPRLNVPAWSMGVPGCRASGTGQANPARRRRWCLTPR